MDTIQLSRGYIGDQAHHYDLPSYSSTASLADLYDRQQRGEALNLDQYNSSFVDKLLWSTTSEDYAAVIAFSRYLALLALNQEFREDLLRDPRSKLPTMARFSFPAEQAYIFTERTDKRLYVLQDNPEKIKEGTVLLQDLNGVDVNIRVVEPPKLIDINQYLWENNYDFNYQAIRRLLFSSGVAESDFKRVMDDILRGGVRIAGVRIAEEERTWFDGVNRAYNVGLRTLRDEHMVDLVTRGVADLFFLFGEGAHEYFSVSPENVSSEHYFRPSIPPISRRVFLERALLSVSGQHVEKPTSFSGESKG